MPDNPQYQHQRIGDLYGPLELKSFGALEIKNEASGEVAAIVATLGVVDNDGDVLLPGSFPHSPSVKMSGYGHDIVLNGASPVGKGSIGVEGDKAVFRGRFFMSSQRGREAFNVVKELGADADWSFGWQRILTKTTPMTDEWRAKGARRLISGLPPALEASPVFLPGGVGTGTLFTKSAKPAESLEELNARADRMFKRMHAR